MSKARGLCLAFWSTNAGDIVVVPANIGHSVRSFNEGEMIVIGLDTSLVAPAVALRVDGGVVRSIIDLLA